MPTDNLARITSAGGLLRRGARPSGWSRFRCEDLPLIRAYLAYRAFGLSPRTAITAARRDAALAI